MNNKSFTFIITLILTTTLLFANVTAADCLRARKRCSQQQAERGYIACECDDGGDLVRLEDCTYGYLVALGLRLHTILQIQCVEQLSLDGDKHRRMLPTRLNAMTEKRSLTQRVRFLRSADQDLRNAAGWTSLVR